MQAVSSSIVCLPPVDAGGYGAKAESWAFGTDFEGLQVCSPVCACACSAMSHVDTSS